MNSTTYPTSLPAASQVSFTSLARATAVLLAIEFLLMFPPLVILGAAINWPASLDEPAAVNLPLILEQYPAVLLGYGIYLVYSLLFWPVAYLTGRVIVGYELENPLLRVANGFAALSTMARALGIVRWLFAMPVLARLYTAPAATPELQASLSAMYEMLNAYAGGVGELLGVSLFTVIWLVLINSLIIRQAQWPNWLGYFGFTAAAFLFLNLLELIGFDMGPMISISVAVLHFWMLATAFLFFRQQPA